MCIVSFVINDDEFILTFNRDESAFRPATAPHWFTENGKQIFAPIDNSKGGTWIGFNGKIIFCLQNGAFEKHVRHTPYRMSRGLLLKQLLLEELVMEDLNSKLLDNIEPFTLSAFDKGTGLLNVLRFDSHTLTRNNYSPQPGLVNCSATLYNAEARAIIQKRFDDLPVKQTEVLMNFHKQHKIGSVNNTFTSVVPTVSITQFIWDNKGIHSRYYDCQTGEEHVSV
ncbi:MAG: NRDE family protein [Bacteroidota bacterium]